MSDTAVAEDLWRYSPKQIAKILGGRSTPFILGLIHTGKLKATKEGRIYFITAKDLKEYLDSQDAAGPQ